MREARTGNGTPRHSRKAACARATMRSRASGEAGVKVSSTSPVAGFTDWMLMAGSSSGLIVRRSERLSTDRGGHPGYSGRGLATSSRAERAGPATARSSTPYASEHPGEGRDQRVDLGLTRHDAERARTARLEQHAFVQESREHRARHLRVTRDHVTIVADRARGEVHAEERGDARDLAGHSGSGESAPQLLSERLAQLGEATVDGRG